MIRFFHKYLSLIISIQLLLWTVSGIYFAFNKIELVRGEQYLLENQAEDLNLEEVEITFTCLLYTSPSPRDHSTSRMPSSA